MRFCGIWWVWFSWVSFHVYLLQWTWLIKMLGNNRILQEWHVTPTLSKKEQINQIGSILMWLLKKDISLYYDALAIHFQNMLIKQ